MTAPSARLPLRAPRGTTLSCRSWLTEAPLRMLMNNLDPEVAERPSELVVYGGIGKAARNWQCYEQIVSALRELNEDETLLIQSGKPVGVFRTHADAPRVLLANSNLVARWADWDHFNELDRKGLMMFGQMTAGSWIYIGSQGIVQGTYETFVELGRQHYGGNLAGSIAKDKSDFSLSINGTDNYVFPILNANAITGAPARVLSVKQGERYVFGNALVNYALTRLSHNTGRTDQALIYGERSLEAALASCCGDEPGGPLALAELWHRAALRRPRSSATPAGPSSPRARRPRPGSSRATCPLSSKMPSSTRS